MGIFKIRGMGVSTLGEGINMGKTRGMPLDPCFLGSRKLEFTGYNWGLHRDHCRDPLRH